MRIRAVIAVLSILSISSACKSNRTEEVSKVTKEQRIMDDGNLLTPEQEETIYALIQDLETNIGSQIAVLTLESLGGQPMNDLSTQIANEMHLGRKDYDDGVLIIVAARDHQMRIEVGLGLEKIINDDIAARINREDMGPRFREGDFFNGIKIGVEKIKDMIEENEQLVGQRP
jgi:uncharacterized protein